MKVGRSGSIILVCLCLALSVHCARGYGGNESEIETLVKSLTSEDESAAGDARRKLEEKGAEIVPVLFGKLLTSDWELKPRLLEVLSAHGREFATQKLLQGTDAEKTYAALVYELSFPCNDDHHDYDSPGFKAMVEALLKALKSDDKNLRAAAGAALLYDEGEGSTVFFDHLHEIVPVLISSFDTDLIIDRCQRAGPVNVVLMLIGMNLEVLVGDRFIDVDKEVFSRPPEMKINDPRDPQAYMRKVLSDNRAKVAELRAEWETWWNEHSKLTAAEIGRLMIERSLRVVAADPSSTDDSTSMAAELCLEKWTGSYHFNWNDWWEKNKASYKGPIKHRK